MSLAPRDRDALKLLHGRRYAGAYVGSFDVDMQTRRLTLALYGHLRAGRDDETYLATVTFFGTSALAIANDAGAFPESVRVASFDVSYDDGEDAGAAKLRGVADWNASWSFDGVAYAEHPAVVESLADEGDA